MVFANQHFSEINNVTKKINIFSIPSKMFQQEATLMTFENIRDLGHILRCRTSLGACYFYVKTYCANNSKVKDTEKGVLRKKKSIAKFNKIVYAFIF